jgi:hypothetical protein
MCIYIYLRCGCSQCKYGLVVLMVCYSSSQEMGWWSQVTCWESTWRKKDAGYRKRMDMWLVTVNTHFFHNDAVHPVSPTGIVERPCEKYPNIVDLVVILDFYQEVPRWEQLYNSAPLKEAFMGLITGGHRTGYGSNSSTHQISWCYDRLISSCLSL